MIMLWIANHLAHQDAELEEEILFHNLSPQGKTDPNPKFVVQETWKLKIWIKTCLNLNTIKLTLMYFSE